MMFVGRRRCVGRTLCDLHISQDYPSRSTTLISTMPIPSLRGGVRGYSLRWLRQVPAAQLPAVGIGWVIEMQRGGGHFIA